MNNENFPAILIFGKNGQVGFELCRSLSYIGEVNAIDIDDCDLTNKKSILESLEFFKPSIIVNAAAYTAVDKAEKEKKLAFKLNAEAPGIMADWANTNNTLIIHYSTDYVFDGTKNGPWTEEDTPNPLNVYGESKLAGDVNIQNSGCDHFIFRTSWVYGARGKNFYLTMRKLLTEKDELRVVDDQFGAPTWCRTIADVTSIALMQYISNQTLHNKDIFGIYNITNSGSTTWHGFAKAIREQMLGRDNNSKLANIIPIGSDQYQLPAKRPKNSALSSEKIRKNFMIKTLNWQKSLEDAWC